uniref:Secreted protein n=1 Tax=Panagrolaimus sp. JU765 TaxID=591449 RepID=A0AC34RD28_9BILA
MKLQVFVVFLGVVFPTVFGLFGRHNRDVNLIYECTYYDVMGTRLTSKISQEGGVEGWTNWPMECSYSQNIYVKCSTGKLNPEAKIELWEDDNREDDLIQTYTWNSTMGQNDATLVVNVDKSTLSEHDTFLEAYVELYFKFINPCSDGKNYIRGDVMAESIIFE